MTRDWYDVALGPDGPSRGKGSTVQPETQQNDQPDLREYLSVLRRRKWSIVAVALMIVALSIALTLRQVPVYTSEARVLVLPTAPANSPFYFLVTINMDTESGLVSSDVVAQLVQDNLGTKTEIGKLLSRLSVGVEAGTEILDIDYTSPDSAQAQKISQAFAEAYLQFREAQAEEQIRSQIVAIQNQITSVTNKINNLQQQIDIEPNATARQELINQQDAQIGRLGVLQQNLADTGASRTVQAGGQIVQSAFLPSSPSNAGPIRNGTLALIVGLSIGIGVAFLRERLDDRLRGREDLENYLGAPVLAVVPHVRQWRHKKEARLTTLAEPDAPAAEAYRALRTSVLFMAGQGNLKVLLVTSPSAGDGKTTTAANLAVTLAQAGKSVILVGADLRKPRIHRFFPDISNRKGLVDVLNGELRLPDALQTSRTKALSVMASGPISPRPAELLHDPRMAEIIAGMRTMADFVIIDSAPVLAVADSLALANHVDAVLLVAEAQNTNRQAVARARGLLEQVAAPVVGAVMNNVDRSKAGGGYYYRYYYRYGYGQGGYGGVYGDGDGRRADEPTSRPSKT